MKSGVVAYIKKSVNNDFLRKAFVLVSGTAISQLIPILTAPFITRLYSPENYGVLGLYMIVSGILGLLATLQFQHAIIKEKDDLLALNAFELCVILSFLVALVSLIPILFFGEILSNYLNSPGLNNWLVIVPFSVLLTGLNNTLFAWANRKSFYRLMSIGRMLSAILTPILSISLAFVFSGPTGLLVGFLAGQLMIFLVFGSAFLKVEKGKLEFTRMDLIRIWKAHIDFPKFNLLSEFLNLFIAQFPMLILGRYYGLAAVGQFNLSNRILNMPSMFVSQSIGEVFRQRASAEYHKNGRCDVFFKKTFVSLLVLGILPFTIIFLFGPDLFRMIFGDKWTEAGVFSRILAPMFFLRFVISPLTFVSLLAGRHYISLIGSVVYAATTILLSYIISSVSDNVYILLIGYVVNFIAIYLVMFYLNYKYSKGYNEIGK